MVDRADDEFISGCDGGGSRCGRGLAIKMRGSDGREWELNLDNQVERGCCEGGASKTSQSTRHRQERGQEGAGSNATWTATGVSGLVSMLQTSAAPDSGQRPFRQGRQDIWSEVVGFGCPLVEH